MVSKIGNKELSELDQIIAGCDQDFLLKEKKSAILKVFKLYLRSPHQEVFTLFEKKKRPEGFSVLITVLATDWAGMVNAVAGIIHQKVGNIPYIRGFSLNFRESEFGVVQCYLNFKTVEEVNALLSKKHQLTASIKASSAALKGKILLLEDETIKLEIFNRIVTLLKKTYPHNDLDEIIGENGEALKFIASRSREYLEERKIEDLAEIILDNFEFQKKIRNNFSPICIKIKNIHTKYEHLTGITFCCRLENFSVEHFLKTLEFLVPNQIIKHHKSFITRDNLLVYRLEIVDSQGEPLDPTLNRLIENTLQKIIRASIRETLVNIRNFGGFEHIARALIPFLMEQVNQTALPHLFINIEKLDEFVLQLKLINLHFKKNRNFLLKIIQELEKIKGIEVMSAIPPRIYKKVIQVNLISLKVTLAEFTGIADIFFQIKSAFSKVFGNFRDFNEGMRESDLQNYLHLTRIFPQEKAELIKKIYYSLDEIYRLSTPVEVISELIAIVINNIKHAAQKKLRNIVINFRNIDYPGYRKTAIVISAIWEKNLQFRLFNHLKPFDFYFTKIEWEHRNFLLLALKKDGAPLSREEFDSFIQKNFSPEKKNIMIFTE